MKLKKNDFNLNIPRYIDSQKSEDAQDIEGHLRGGIPALDVEALEEYWKVCPQLRKSLFSELRPGYLKILVEKSEIKSTIHGHPEFAQFMSRMEGVFEEWRKSSTARLSELKIGIQPKKVILDLGESLLVQYQGKPLIDHYDVYQHLMDYWSTTMQDDCYLISADGWKANTYRVIETKKGKDGKPGKAVDKGWTCDLVPKNLVVSKYFYKEQTAIAEMESEIETLNSQLTELEEEQGSEEGLFSELDKVNRANVFSRFKEIKSDKTAKDEAAALSKWLELFDRQAELKKSLKDAEAALDSKACAKYPTLTEAEIKALVVEDKWMATLGAAVHGEMERISQSLTQRLKDLAERYDVPMPQISQRVAQLEAKVNQHLAQMGFTL